MKKIILVMITAMLCNVAFAQNRVTGKVTSSDDGSIVPYANVHVKGMMNGTTTNDDGTYVLDNVPSDAILVFTFVGYQTLEVPVNGRSIVNAELKSDAFGLEEVMVVAYGTVKKGSYAGSASVVRSNKIKDVPVASFEQALAGNVAGMQVNQISGVPGSSPQITIRGIGSFNAGTQPLYVIDGVPTTSGDGTGTWASANTMSFLNPNDVESITVLKDAAAASLYGSRAANGVVLITTKKGKEGKPLSTFRASVGISNFAMDNLPLATEAETEMLHREALTNYANKYPTDPDVLEYSSIQAFVDDYLEYYYPARKEGYQYVKWADELMQTGIAQNYEYSMSSGTKTSNIYASVSYSDIQGILVLEGMTRVSATLNAEQKAFNDRFTFGANFQFGQTKSNGHQEGWTWDNPFWAVKMRLTDRYPIRYPDGSYYNVAFSDGYKNPMAHLDKQKNESKQYRTMVKGYAELKIIEGLNLKTVLSYDNNRSDDQNFWLYGHHNGDAYGNGFVEDVTTLKEKVVSSTTLNFNRSFGDHTISALVGWEAERSYHKYLDLAKGDFANYALISTAVAATYQWGANYMDNDRLLSALTSVNYDYKGKYFLSGSYRRDGSSRLHPNTRWGNFASVSGAWRISSEKFMDNANWMDDLRVRASYGSNGILPSSWYGYMSLFDYSTYGSGNTAYPANLALGQELTWEKNNTWNVGLDFAIFNRVSGTIEYYERITKDLLLNAQVPTTTGFSSSLMNIGSMSNKGLEVAINVDIIKNKDLTWTLGANWSSVKNEILALNEDSAVLWGGSYSQFRRVVGRGFYDYYLVETAGVDPQTGEAQFWTNKQDADGNVISREITKNYNEASKTYIGKSALPKGQGGINTSLSWKGLSLNLNFTYGYGNYILDYTSRQLQGDGYDMRNNIHRDQLNRWQEPGDVTDVPQRIAWRSNGGNSPSDRMLVKGDYLRLKNATISYSLPSKWMNPISFQSARVYVSGTNLFTLTGSYVDPEGRMDGYYNFYIPQMRTVTFGVEFSF